MKDPYKLRGKPATMNQLTLAVSQDKTSVLYMCLKTMTKYEENKHRKKLGLPVSEEPTTSTVIDSQDADLEVEDLEELPDPENDSPENSSTS